jgi:small subunit ribosomal protein S24e
MKVEIISETENPLLERKEVQFRVDHDQTGSTPPRLEIRNAIATALKATADLVFVKKFTTKTGTSVAFGLANVYNSAEQAKLIEPAYIVERNVPSSEKPKEEVKAETAKPAKEENKEKPKEPTKEEVK